MSLSEKLCEFYPKRSVRGPPKIINSPKNYIKFI